MENKSQIAVLSLYSFIEIAEPKLVMEKIFTFCSQHFLKGTILIAHEGFNGSVSGSLENVRLLADKITSITGAKEVMIKVNYCENHPFQKLKVKIKEETISLRVGFLDINNLKGEYIETHDWDNFISREDVILIDTRNYYEVEAGTFKNSIDPKTDSFKEFPAWVENNKDSFKNKKIAMYCTGGVRCEKSTAYLKKLGYNEVYHLKGGILQYLEDTNNINNLWHGNCVVFDERMEVLPNLSPVNVHEIIHSKQFKAKEHC